MREDRQFIANLLPIIITGRTLLFYTFMTSFHGYVMLAATLHKQQTTDDF